MAVAEFPHPENLSKPSTLVYFIDNARLSISDKDKILIVFSISLI